MLVRDYMSPGQISAYSGELGIWLWRMGNCSITILNEDGIEVDVFTWAVEPTSIHECITWCKERARRLVAEAEEENRLHEEELDEFEQACYIGGDDRWKDLHPGDTT